jgi:hypothetical protein
MGGSTIPETRAFWALGCEDLRAAASLREGSLLQFYDFASKSTHTVYRTSAPVSGGLTLAPDGRRILFTQQDRRGSDLMLVENFR